MGQSQTAGDYVVLVQYDVTPDRQDMLTRGLQHEVERWVRHRDGFVTAQLRPGIDGQHVVAWLVWRTREDAVNYLESPEKGALWEVIKSAGTRERQSTTCSHGIRVGATTRDAARPEQT